MTVLIVELVQGICEGREAAAAGSSHQVFGPNRLIWMGLHRPSILAAGIVRCVAEGVAAQ
jgi:hypothetical protein